MNSIHDQCGIFAVVGHPRAAEMCYYGLYALQHRGQESAGIALGQGPKIKSKKGIGLVSDVFTGEDLRRMPGNRAIGHVRYAVDEEITIENAQPITVKMWRGWLSVANNGSLVNAHELRDLLEQGGSIFQTTSDSEVVAHLMARSKAPDTASALEEALGQIKGAYSLGILTPQGAVAARDPHGCRPLCIGQIDGAYVISSETCGLDAVGAQVIREVSPGEIVSITMDGPSLKTGHSVEALASGTARRVSGPCRLQTKQVMEPLRQSLCVFEFIYFARPDSDISGLNVHAVRKALGRKLARKGPVEADLVTGVPDSSLSAAAGFAEEAGLPYEMGLVKNRYIGRTFIAPEQALRELAVRIKLNPLRSLIEGKRVVLVDDSIVRGTTSRHIIGLLRSAGAKEVHVRISSPPYRFPCYYGIDTPSACELPAATLDVEAIRERIGADSLVYLDLQDLKDIVGARVPGFCSSCFDGDYPVDVSGMGNADGRCGCR